MVDNISYVQGTTHAMVIIRYPHVSTASLSKRVEGLKGHIGPSAMQPVPCPSRSYVGRDGHGRLVNI